MSASARGDPASPGTLMLRHTVLSLPASKRAHPASGALRFHFDSGEEINAIQSQNQFLHNLRTIAEVFCHSEAGS